MLVDGAVERGGDRGPIEDGNDECLTPPKGLAAKENRQLDATRSICHLLASSRRLYRSHGPQRFTSNRVRMLSDQLRKVKGER